MIILLAPLTLLLLSVSRSAGDDIGMGTRERDGIEYLTQLGPLTAALATAQSDAVAGRGVSRDTLTQATEAVEAVDARLGERLGTVERWSDLRTRIAGLASQAQLSGGAAYDAYTEVADLALALCGKVRESSELVREPSVDAYLLHHSVAEDLPGATVAMGRFGDLAALAGSRPDRALAAAEVIAARDSALRFGTHLVNDLQGAVLSTTSSTLSANLFPHLDRLRIAMNSATQTTTLGDTVIGPAEIAAIGAAREAVASAIAPLAEAVLGELHQIVASGISAAESQRQLASLAFSLAVLLAFALAVLAVLPRRVYPPRFSSGGPGADGPLWSPPAGAPTVASRERSGAPR